MTESARRVMFANADNSEGDIFSKNCGSKDDDECEQDDSADMSEEEKEAVKSVHSQNQ